MVEVSDTLTPYQVMAPYRGVTVFNKRHPS